MIRTSTDPEILHLTDFLKRTYPEVKPRDGESAVDVAIRLLCDHRVLSVLKRMRE